MKAAIIFIAGKIRQGQFPKLPGFAYSEEYGKYLYSGAPVPLDEFNAAAEQILDPADRRFSISVRIVDVLTPEDVARIAKEEAEAKAAEEASRVAAEKAEADRIAKEEAAKLPAEPAKAAPPTAADLIAAKKAAHKTSTP